MVHFFGASPPPSSVHHVGNNVLLVKIKGSVRGERECVCVRLPVFFLACVSLSYGEGGTAVTKKNVGNLVFPLKCHLA